MRNCSATLFVVCIFLLIGCSSSVDNENSIKLYALNANPQMPFSVALSSENGFSASIVREGMFYAYATEEPFEQDKLYVFSLIDESGSSRRHGIAARFRLDDDQTKLSLSIRGLHDGGGSELYSITDSYDLQWLVEGHSSAMQKLNNK